jgi:sulfur-carrier protein adenylyltransferase/sulfurtransferase
MSNLSPAELRRYARHLSLAEFGMEGQLRLKAARVLCIGAGGLGSPVVMHLAAAGVGVIGIVEDDVVEESNLQRQLLHGTKDLGRSKLASAKDRLRDMNPQVDVIGHEARFTRENAMGLVGAYDMVVDGTDNFPTRYLSNDVCVFLKKPNVYGSILRFEGQCSVFAPHLGGPCYRCLSPQPPAPGLVPSCADGGVLGVMPGIIGTLQATEVIKLIAGIGEPLIGRLLHVDALAMKFRTFNLNRDPQCPVCGDQPSITGPIDYEGFCGVRERSVPEITVRDLKAKRERGEDFVLLDVREPFEHALAHIEGATRIPLGELESRLHELPRGKEIAVHCRTGGRSATAVGLLLKSGFPGAVNVAGGIAAWSDQVDSRVPKY